jgi:hypothetical protein
MRYFLPEDSTYKFVILNIYYSNILYARATFSNHQFFFMKNYHRSLFLLSLLFIICSFCKAQELVECAKENEKYYFETKTDVAYGVSGTYTYKYGITGWVTFDNAAFGDPVQGVAKSGYYVRTKTNAIRIYDEPNFTGAYHDLKLEDVSQVPNIWFAKIGSVQVPDGYKMIVYESRDFSGFSNEIAGNWTKGTGSRDIYSYKLYKIPLTRTTTNDPVKPMINPVRLYEHANYDPPYIDIPLADASWLGNDWNKKISSVKVPDGYKMIAFDAANFQGASVEITGDWTLNADNMQWNDRITSFRIVKWTKSVVTTDIISTPAPLPANVYVRVFDNFDYTGEIRDFGFIDIAATLGQWDKKIDAVQIREGYKLIVYDNAALKGNSIELTGNWSAGHRMDWHDRISSFSLMDKNKQLIVDNNSNNVVQNNIPEPINFQKQFIRMSTAAHGDNLRLDYSPVDKKFVLQPNSHNWKIVLAGPNKYKILLQVNGKYWALSSTPDAHPGLAEDTSGMYQFWQIEKLPDGYYKINNWGLVQMNSSYPSLFYDGETKELFLMTWQETKSVNGRWSLLSAGNIPEGDHPDALDKRGFVLISVSSNKQMCLQSILINGDNPTEIIGECKGQDGKIQVIKTFNGDYFIRINKASSPNKYYYLDDRLRRIDDLRADATNPDPKFTWKIKDTGYGVYTITNTSTKQVFNLSSQLKLQLTVPANKNTEQWYLR